MPTSIVPETSVFASWALTGRPAKAVRIGTTSTRTAVSARHLRAFILGRLLSDDSDDRQLP
jgi:hypothetical protein